MILQITLRIISIQMDKESSYLLQLIDCNCNDCKFMERDFKKLENHKLTYRNTGIMDRLTFGNCNKFQKAVSFIPQTCQIDTQNCFEHRKKTL